MLMTKDKQRAFL